MVFIPIPVMLNTCVLLFSKRMTTDQFFYFWSFKFFSKNLSTRGKQVVWTHFSEPHTTINRLCSIDIYFSLLYLLLSDINLSNWLGGKILKVLTIWKKWLLTSGILYTILIFLHIKEIKTKKNNIDIATQSCPLCHPLITNINLSITVTDNTSNSVVFSVTKPVGIFYDYVLKKYITPTLPLHENGIFKKAYQKKLGEKVHLFFL